MLKTVMETSSFVWGVVGLETGQGWLSYILPKYALVSDELYHDGDPPKNDLLTLSNAYGMLVQIPSTFWDFSKDIPKPTQEQLDELGAAFGDECDGECSIASYYGTMALLEYTKSINGYFYVLPGLREGFIKFCLNNKPDFLNYMKKSFLFCSVLDFLFDHHIPAFEPAKSITNLSQFKDFKDDFQKGVISFVKQFEGSYELSDEQKEYMKEAIANDEAKVTRISTARESKKM
jgi:hypothetical protein